MSNYIREIRTQVGSRLLQVPSVTIINFDDNNRILLIKHRDTNSWVAPGGTIEPGETPADAAAREMWEETGLVVDLIQIIGVYGGPEFVVEYPNGDETSYVMTVFESRCIGGSLNPTDEEAVDVGYFGENDCLSLKTQPWMRTVLPGIFNRSNKPLFKQAIWKPSVS